jgi:aminopeptidase N
MFRNTRVDRARRVLVATVLVVGALVASGPAQAGPGPGQGSGSLGDSYYPDYGNGGYHVDHYDLKVRYQPQTDELSGVATITARATSQLSSFDLDFLLDVSSVTVNGMSATFARAGAHKLVITPRRSIRNHEVMTVVVRYSGLPSKVLVNGSTSWKRTSDGALAVNEPEISWWWYPSNDHPQNKATYDISITVPEGVQAISNGVLTSPPVAVEGWASWNWHSEKPMATYLAFIAIGKYDIESSTAPNGQPVTLAYAKNLDTFGNNARASIRRTPEVIGWESTLFGPYPFEAQGGVAGPVDGIGFSLETQTRPVYGWKFWSKGPNMYVIVHELAHQWFGDNVSVHNWQDIWLNEGFASYVEWLWSEQHGEGTAQQLFDKAYAAKPAEDPFWQVLPGDPGAADLFAGAVYDRGAMALHQLRLAVGDKKFLAILTGWGKHKKYRNATITEFRKYAERLSNMDLEPLFNTWLYTKGRPTLGTPKAAGVELTPVTMPASWELIQSSRER